MEYKLIRHYLKFGQMLQSARIRRGLTQREVAIDMLGYSSAQFISNFERGIVTPPLKKLKELIRIYGLSYQKVVDMYLQERKSELKKDLT